MPSDEMVEKARDAIRDAVGCHTTTGRPGVGCMTMDVPELCSCWVAAKAALAAAEAGEPVAWVRADELAALRDGPKHGCATIYRSDEAAGLNTLDAGEVAALYASPPSEASRDERNLLDQMGRHTNWELSMSGGWTDDPARWTVHEVTGGRNDRVWTAIGEGATPAEAIATATRARGET